MLFEFYTFGYSVADHKLKELINNIDASFIKFNNQFCKTDSNRQLGRNPKNEGGR